MKAKSKSQRLPAELKPLFWEFDFEKLSWAKHRDTVVAKVLQSGTLDNWQWLRGKLGDRELRDWILKRNGRGLSSRQLRFWEYILKLPKKTVERWLKAEPLRIWEGRLGA